MVNWNISIYRLETEERKEIPLLPILKRELLRYLKIRGEIGRNEYVFIYIGCRFKGRSVSGQVVYKEFRRYAQLTGIPPTRTIHGMRHRAVTSWLELGFNIYESAQFAGHSTQRVTGKYAHLTSKHLKSKMDRLTTKRQ